MLKRVRRATRRRVAAVAMAGAMLAAAAAATAGPVQAAGPNLILNGGFESGLTSWFVNNGNATDGATLSPTTDAYAGSGAVLVTNRKTTGSGPMQDLSGKVQAGKTYAITARVKYENPNSPATKQFFATMHYGGSTYTNVGTVTVARGQWGLIQSTFTIPAGQNVTTARLFIETPWTANPASAPDTHLMDFKVDEVSVSEFVPSTTIEVLGKNPGEGNPLISHKFGADGNAFVHNGRVYLYLTNDTQMYNPGPNGISPTNTYGGINTITVISSDDLVNWVDHGEIPVAGPNGLARYANQSWAPAVESKVVDGKEKFFLYYANNGGSTGVLVGDTPLGPWRDERGSLLITSATPGASNGRNWLFDPGVFVDDDGQGYLYFGGGGDDGSRTYENTNHPKSTRVIKLGDDMISTKGSAEVIDAPLVFEAGHVFKRNDRYYYSYSSNFGFSGPVDPNGPPTGAIAYLMADNPMGPWTADKYAGIIFRNPGTYFGAGGNNHQSVFKLDGQYYFTYHAQTLNSRITGGATQGFRSPHLAKLDFNADGTIKEVRGDYKGVEQIRNLNPYRVIEAETIAWQQGIATKKIDGASAEFGAQAPNLVVHDIDNGDWTSLAKVDFGEDGAVGVTAKVRPLVAGGKIQLRLGDRAAPVAATIPVDAPLGEWTTLTAKLDGITGVHEVYFTYAGPDGVDLFEIDSWAFDAKKDTTPPTISVSGVTDGQEYGDSQDLTIGWTADDADSGMKSVTGTLDGEPFEPGTIKPLYELALGEHTLAVTAVDNAGNKAEQTVKFSVVTSTDHIAALIDRFEAAGKLTAKSAHRLRINLATVRDAQEKDKKNDKVVKELQKFQDLVNDGEVVTDPQVRDTLLRDADALIAQYGDAPEN
ncbi:family 43 glycosylhydrolase [Acrocarpospora catenulata]|uniref:family 43 glycosylhydrolase n=1 Tax=Acrocarpospora catenulata TaxID=2836182 RepID=UPI001BD9BAAC|nr:family 43 glycosylhydrolase [Acrocarpospora catenulata]